MKKKNGVWDMTVSRPDDDERISADFFPINNETTTNGKRNENMHTKELKLKTLSYQQNSVHTVTASCNIRPARSTLQIVFQFLENDDNNDGDCDELTERNTCR